MMRHRRWLWLAAAVLGAGCGDPTVSATGTITAPAEVRALVSREAPAYLYLAVVYGTGVQERGLGVFCDLPATTPFDFQAFSCAKTDTATLTASLRALPLAKLPSGWTCQERRPDVAYTFNERLIASATTTVPIDREPGACDSGSIRADLTLSPTR